MTAHIRELTGARGVAALLVVGFHALYFALIVGQAWPQGLAAQVLAHGWLGVDFFLVLSAFLICLPWYGPAPERFRPAFWSGYALRRFLRLAPAYWVSIPLALTAYGAVPYLWTHRADVLSHMFFLHGFRQETFQSISPVYWTLAIEVQLYLLLPFIAGAIRRGHGPWLLAVSLASSVLWRWFMHSPNHHDGFWLVNQAPGFLVHAVAGAWVARWWVEGRLDRPSWVRVLGVLGLLLIVVPLWAFDPKEPFQAPTAVGDALMRPLLALGFAALLLPLIRDRFASRLLGSGPLQWIGRSSYSLYLVHMPVGFALLPVLESAHAAGPAPFVAVLMAVSVLAASAFYMAVERPAVGLPRWTSVRARLGRRPVSWRSAASDPVSAQRTPEARPEPRLLASGPTPNPESY